MSFKELGLSENLLKTIREIGYETPTPIQKESIPEILRGRDLLACAQTGTGKTASFSLPLIEILQGTRKRNRLPRAIILEPTRELAAQVEENILKYAGDTSLSTVLLVGGEIVTSQERKLKKGVDIIIATPGRIIDMFDRGKVIFTDIKAVIIDEADRMLDMGFMPDVDRILSMLPKLRQTLLFSATVAKEIKHISTRYQLNPKQITVTRPAKTAETIDQHIVKAQPRNKRKILRKILSTHPSQEPIIVFCNRKRDVDIVTKSLCNHGYLAQAFHGDMTQHARNETLEKFKKSEFKILVTSDIAARGIDVSDVSLVVNFDLPVNNEDYVHRIGRTGRAGKLGKAITFVMPSEDKKLKRLEYLIKKSITNLDIVVEEDITEEATEKKKLPSSRTTRPVRELREPTVPIIGFGDFIPAFMLIDPYSRMHATT